MKYLYIPLISSILAIAPNSFSMNFDEARNIVSKTSIGTSPIEINNILNLNTNQGIDNIVNSSANQAELTPPEWVNQNLEDYSKKGLTPEQKKVIRQKFNKQERELKLWWYRQMITTKSPLTERMTLFWHNHFTSSTKKVRIPKLMYNQNVLLRKNSLGNFKTLLHEISKDPAMLLYLDNQQNRKNKPNENFAREVMELFTLGEGKYTEKDIKEAARAFTGWKINRETGEYFFDKKTHDNKNKTFMGKTGNFDGDQILDILLERPEVSTFITRKIWKEFIGISPVETEIKRIAKTFRNSGYNIKTLVAETLKSKSFSDSKNYGSIIKSPVEVIVGTIRTLNIPIEDKNKNLEQMIKYGQRLGQDILNPPNVKGWVGGYSWINSGTLPVREQIIQRVTRGNEPFSRPYQEKNINTLPSKSIIDLWTDNSEDFSLVQKVLLPLPPVKPVTEKLNKMNFIRTIVLDPVYQLR